MIVDDCQRWTERRASRRPAGELIATSEYEVAPISAAIARAFVQQHHYSATCSSPAHTFGLFRRSTLVGVACFGPPASENAHRAVFPTLSFKEAVTLGRLVLLDEVPGNGESWFVARCFELLASPKLYRPFNRDGSPRVPIVGVESCADPQPRTKLDGSLVFRGHLGTIYCALNGRYVGKTNDSTLRLLPDGTVFSNRASGKVVQGDQGKDYAAAQLIAWGAEPMKSGEDALLWIQRWREKLTRSMRHRGNHRYLWALDKRRAHEIVPIYGPFLPYPKLPGWGAAKECS